ncbi:acyl--CoA ligase [Mycolicibacterium sp. 3033]|nr:acyl--CoA ligase [Mycolicibacterium aurantiacum]
MPFPSITPTFPALIRSSAARFGDSPFLVCAGETLSYMELDRRSARLARTLLGSGVGKGSHVGILMPNGIDWALTWFAVTRIGAVAVPLNTFYQAEELAWTVKHADLAVICAVPAFRNHDFARRLEKALPGLAEQDRPALAVQSAPHLRAVSFTTATDRAWASCLLEATPHLDEDHLIAAESAVTPADRAALIYTSGSTGDPKAPVHSQGTVVRHSYNLTFPYGIDAKAVVFTSMPFFWIGGLITGLNAVIHHGATLITQPAFDAADALELMERHRATIVLGWPQQGKTLAAHPDFDRRDLTSVRRTSMPAMVPEDRRPTGPHGLGMTELCGNHLGVDPYLPQPADRRDAGGHSIEGLQHVIADPDTGEPVPDGVPGEIWVRGYSLMQGLYKREREDVFTADGYYRTGDCGVRHADGWITFTGRLGDLIKTGGGTNVTPDEVEAALTTCDGVLEAYVVGIADGDHGTVVAAAVVPGNQSTLDGELLRAQVRKKLSAYKVPKHIWIVAKDDLPFTASGKVRKPALAEDLSRRVATS